MAIDTGAAAARAAAEARRRAAEAARQRAAQKAAAQKAAAQKAAAQKAAAQKAAQQKAQQAAAQKAAAQRAKEKPLHPKERPTKNRNAFVAPVEKAGGTTGPIRERATKNRSAFVAGSNPLLRSPLEKPGVSTVSAPVKERVTRNRSVYGPELPATKLSKPQRDVQAINEAADRSPEEGARVLEQRLKATDSEKQREKLLADSYGAIDQITTGLRQPGVTQAQTDQTVAALAGAASTVDRRSAQTIASRLQAGGNPLTAPSPLLSTAPSDTAGAELRINSALKTNASLPGAAQLAGGVADAYRTEGRYDEANAVAALSPKFKVTAKESVGETQARDALDLDTVKEKRDNLETNLDEGAQQTRDEAHSLIEKATSGKLPKGYEAELTADGAVLTKRDKSGNVVERTVALEGENGAATVQTTIWATKNGKGVATMSESSVDADRALSTTQASWKQSPSKSPPSVDTAALERDTSGDVSYQRTTLLRDGDNLVSEQLTAQGGAVSGSTSTFSTQDDTDGLDDKLDGKFSDGTIDRVETRSYNIAKPGTKDADGNDVKPTYTRTQTYSQDGVQASSTATKQLGNTFGANDGRSISELRAVREDLKAEEGEDGESFDGNEDSPKQWNLETSSGNTYKAQTFIEGSPDASVTTTRTATGSSVVERQEGKWFDSEGELKEVNGDSTREFGSDGRLTAFHQRSLDADGTTTVQDFKREQTMGPNGQRQWNEELNVRSVTEDGETSTYAQEQKLRETANGVDLVSARQEVTSPQGRAVASINGRKSTLSVDGVELEGAKDLEGLSEEQRELVDHTRAALGNQIAQHAASQGVDLTDGLPKSESKAGEGAGNAKTAIGFGQAGLSSIEGPLKGQFTTPDGGTAIPISARGRSMAFDHVSGNLSVLSSGVGVIGAGQQLFAAIGKGDAQAIITSGTDLAANTAGLAAGGVQSVNALRAAPSELLGARTAAIASKLGYVAAGVSGGFDIYGGIKEGDGYQIAKGVVTIGGAVAAPILGTLAGTAVAGSVAGSVVPGAGTVAGFVVGALVGVGAWGIGKGFDALSDKEHEIADVKI